MTSGETPAAARRRILVIDDEESLRHALGKALKRAGFEVETAATGGEGVERLRAGGFHAVVTDVRLPDLSGLDIVALLTETAPGVPVLVMTGYGSVETALEAMRRGARDFLQKPFEAADLVRLLVRELAHTEGAEAERRLRAQVERRFAPDDYARVESELRRTGAAGPEPSLEGEPIGSTPPASAGAREEDALAASGDPLALREAQRRFEVQYVEDLLVRTGGNVAAAARLAGISRPNFHKKCKALGVDPARFKAAHRRGRSAGL
jgi:DNA-binding NtrC family response regulator